MARRCTPRVPCLDPRRAPGVSQVKRVRNVLKRLRDEAEAVKGSKGRHGRAYGRYEREMSSVLLWTPEVERLFDAEAQRRK